FAFDGLHDFAPIAKIGFAPLVIVVPASSPAKTLKDLIAMAKAEPGKLTYASAGNGSSGHLAGELLKSTAKVDILHVPYKGGAPAITDLLGRAHFVHAHQSGRSDGAYSRRPTARACRRE